MTHSRIPNASKGSTVISSGRIIMRPRLVAVTFIDRNEFVDVETVFAAVLSIRWSDAFQIDLNTQWPSGL